MYRIYSQAKNKSFPEASKEHIIKITFKDETPLGLTTDKTYGTLIGYLNNEFEYSAKGNYTDVFNVTKIDSQALKLFEDSIQRNIGNYGLLTKKMYTNGESPTLTVNFRCWAGDKENSPNYTGSRINKENKRDKDSTISNPVLVANALINATMPRVSSESILTESDVPDAMEKVFQNSPVGAIFKSVGYQGTIIDKISQVPGNVVDGAKNLANSFLNILSKKPPVCFVEIGNIFAKDMMVVASVEVKFSKEYYDKGIPLYGDYNVTLQSLYAGSVLDSMGSEIKNKENIFGSGLNSKKGTRVTFDDQNVTVDSSKEIIGKKFNQYLGTDSK